MHLFHQYGFSHEIWFITSTPALQTTASTFDVTEWRDFPLAWWSQPPLQSGSLVWFWKLVFCLNMSSVWKYTIKWSGNSPADDWTGAKSARLAFTMYKRAWKGEWVLFDSSWRIDNGRSSISHSPKLFKLSCDDVPSASAGLPPLQRAHVQHPEDQQDFQ